MKKSAHRTLTDFTADAAFAGAATAMTLWYRLPMFGFTSLTSLAQRQAEATRMIDEKAAAMVEGTLMAGMEMIRLAGAVATGRMRADELGAAPVAIAAAGLKPAFRTVRANAKRLNRQALRG
jgi:hypothetical protein